MLVIVGLVTIFAMVFGGFSLAGGKFGIIIKALPFEFMMIGGASLGAYLVGNGGVIAKKGASGFGMAIKGPKWKADDYKDLLCLMYVLSKVMKAKGLIALEAHIENPEESNIFSHFPNIQHDHFAMDLICDTIRMMSMSLEDPHQVEDLIEKQLEKHHHELEHGAGALQAMADGLPAIGIVAAVLGIIKTMGSIDQPPEVLGKMIGGALVGTFLGVFLAYCIVGPIAGRVNQVLAEDHQFYLIIRDSLVAFLHGNAAPVVVEIARGNVPTYIQPSFQTLDEAIQEIPSELTA